MSSYYSNPTADRAIGSVDKLLAIKRKRAKRLYKLSREGRLGPRIREELRREFTGIYRPLLRVALGEISLKELFPQENKKGEA